MRDGANLAWKFDLVLRGLADASLLDTYQPERLPHARQLMLDSRALGLAANTANPVKAAVRDLLFKLKLAPKPKFPILTDGVLARQKGGKPMPHAGTLPAQGRLLSNGGTSRFDDHVGFHFSLVVKPGVTASLPETLQGALRAIDVRIIELAAGVDVDGVYARLLEELQADAAAIRPDFVLYGHARRDAVVPLLEGLLRSLRVHSAQTAQTAAA